MRERDFLKRVVIGTKVETISLVIKLLEDKKMLQA